MSNFDAISAKIAGKKEELNALMEEFNKKLQVEFAEATRFFFEETGIQAVIWNQYTPSFNDGDPCTFTLSDPVFITKGFYGVNEDTGESLTEDEFKASVGDDEPDLLSADEYEDDELYGTVEYTPYAYREDHNTTPMAKACYEFKSLLESIEDILESMYGDGYGTTVYLTKNRVFQAEYECGY